MATNTTAVAVSPTVNFSLRLASQLLGVVIFLVLYFLSWVVLLHRRVHISLYQRFCGKCLPSDKKPSKQQQFLLPLLPSLILVVTNLQLFVRNVAFALVTIQSIINLIIIQHPTLVPTSPFLQLQHIDQMFEQFGLGCTVIAYLISTTAFALLLILWTQTLSTMVTQSKAQARIYQALIIVTVILMVILHLAVLQASAVYFSLQSLRYQIIGTISSYYLMIPVFVIVIAVLVLFMIIVGVKILKDMNAGNQKTTLTVKYKALIAKMTLALIMIPFAMCVRAVGMLIFAAQIPVFSYLQGIYTITTVPDVLITAAIFICFWPFNASFGYIGSCTPTNSVLIAFFRPTTNQELLGEVEKEEVPQVKEEQPKAEYKQLSTQTPVTPEAGGHIQFQVHEESPTPPPTVATVAVSENV